MAQIIIEYNASWWEWVVWAGEILFVFGVLILMEYILRRKQFRKEIIWKSFLAAVCIIFFVVLTGWIGEFFDFGPNGQSFFPVSVVLAFALSLALIYKWIEQEHFKISLIITTIILLIIYTIRILADISLYLP